jgi:hypothetical protein
MQITGLLLKLILLFSSKIKLFCRWPKNVFAVLEQKIKATIEQFGSMLHPWVNI